MRDEMQREVPGRLDRAVGSVLGLAVGDALGAGYEFTTPGQDERIEMRGGGGFGWAPGEWTDDTQMAICVLEELAVGTLDPAAVGDRFLGWYASEPPDVGNQTRAVLGGAASGAELPQRARHYCAENPRCAGNGSLMRTGPVALAHPGDPAAIADVAREISDLTHGDPMCGDACVLWSVAVDHAIRHAEFDVRSGLAWVPKERHEVWSGLIEEAETRPSGSFVPNGWVVTAYQAAWSVISQAVTSGDPLRDALVAAVRIGDDTDTVAAITGTLVGARWGASAIPEEWAEVLHGWPGYRAGDLVRLATAAVAGE